MARAAARTHVGVDKFRRQLYGKIEIAKKALGLDDDTYRDILEAKFGKRSRTQLRTAQLVDLVEHFKTIGFKPKKKAPRRAGTRPLAAGAEAEKARALWISLWCLGVVRDPAESALAAFFKRVTGGRSKGGADALQWMDGAQAVKLIEALKAMAARPVEKGGGGVDWDVYRDAMGRPAFENPRRRVVEAQARILGLSMREAETEGYRLTGHAGFAFYDDKAWDRLIEGLGPYVRRQREKGTAP